MWQQEGRGGQTHSAEQSSRSAPSLKMLEGAVLFQEEKHIKTWCEEQATKPTSHLAEQDTHQNVG